ncbi:MAG: peptide deformylase [bacterium]
MRVYQIRNYGDPILRSRCRRVEEVRDREKKILQQMAKVMYQAQGIGLAAPQVGIDLQLIVVDGGDNNPIKLVNPLILLREGESILEEGCLSLPEVTLKVKRSKRVMVEGWNEDGEIIKIEGEDLLAHVIQHEIDHLFGILIIDYADQAERMSLDTKLKLLEKSGGSHIRL